MTTVDRTSTEVAGRVAFDSWRRTLTYNPAWDWADMSERERRAWIEHAAADGYRAGTQPGRIGV